MKMKNGIGSGGGKLVFCLALSLMCIPATRALGDAGENFKTKCAGCHGPDGGGNTPAGKAMGVHDFKSADVQKESDPDLIAVISNGKGKMPKYSDKLKDTEIKDLVVYVRGLGKT